MNIFVLSTLCFGYSSIFLGVFVWLRRRDSLGFEWLRFSSFAGLWGIFYSFQINNDVTYEVALRMTRIADVFVVLIPAAWLSFLYEYLNLKRPPRLFNFAWLFSFILLCFLPTDYFVPGLKDKSHLGVIHFSDGGPVFHVLTVYYVSMVCFGFVKLVKGYLEKYADLNREDKQKMNLFIVGTVFGFGGGSCGFLPVYDIDIQVLYGALLMLLFPFLITFAIGKYNLLDEIAFVTAAHQNKLKSLGLLTASLSHELKNPLYVIRGIVDNYTAEQGEKKSEGVDVQSAMDKISNQTYRALDTIKRFSVFAASKESDAKVDEDVVLKKLLDDILLFVAHQIKVEDIRVELDIDEGISLSRVNKGQIEEIFLNLIMNAIQAADPEQKRIGIHATYEKEKVVIRVEDNGQGVSENQMKNLFEPFYTTKEEGMGLGLYITKQLVEKNKGIIQVDSQLGQGTAFTLEFPKQ